MVQKLSKDAVNLALADLPAWRCDGAMLERRIDFPDFIEAFRFMSAVANEAERQNHHPDWRNSYGRVEICLQTHEVGGLSVKDFALARAIDHLADRDGSRGAS